MRVEVEVCPEMGPIAPPPVPASIKLDEESMEKGEKTTIPG
jgi:hypothetical protein